MMECVYLARVRGGIQADWWGGGGRDQRGPVKRLSFHSRSSFIV